MSKLSKIYTNTDDNLMLLGKKIFNGEIVIFPTETVFGMGTNGLSETAVDNIFKLKNRPKNNPLILHCLGYNDAKLLVDLNKDDDYKFRLLSEKYWPGPLTVVLKAKKIIPKNVTSNTGYVGLRSPKNDSTRRIIEYSKVPLAAPSANISGKVSSTCIEHVKKYFDSSDVNILDDNYVCNIGIESTVIMLENGKINILREGIITSSELKLFIRKLNIKHNSNDFLIIDDQKINKIISPGQSILHYSPNKPLYILNIIDYRNTFENSSLEEFSNYTQNYLKNSILIDFNKICLKYQDIFLGYVDLSSNGDIKEAIFNLYNVFHQLNDIDCDKIFIYNFSRIENTYMSAIWDRIRRASENKEISIPYNFLNNNTAVY